MAPPTGEGGGGHMIEATPEYIEFIAALRAYHGKRGTNFDPEPKVGHTPVDLLKLFKLIVEHGGYDKVSEEKLAWRNMVNILELYSSNEASAAYSLKLAYYKNLAAYEISTVHKKEPPPPEILEHISAKGGNLLTRTLENYGHRAMRPLGGGLGGGGAGGGGGGSSVGAGDVQSGEDSATGATGTPTRGERQDSGTPASGRASRGLREAPPQRVIFQPDTGPARQTRHGGAGGSGGHGGVAMHSGSGSGSHPGTPGHYMGVGGLPHAAPAMHPAHAHPAGVGPGLAHAPQQAHTRSASLVYNPAGSELFSPAVQAYEPRGPVPIVLQAVDAPANAPAKYLQRARVQRLQAAGVSLSRFATRPPIPPGNDGPNIYMRCLGALRSGIVAEEAFALSHLVKISFERGDKYKFESFPGLAEGLVEKALQVGSLFYHDVQWRVSYGPEEGAATADRNELDGLNGTADLLERIRQLRVREEVLDCVQPAAMADQLVLITEAALTMRNMVTLPENAYFLADFAPARDLLCILLNLPEREATTELRHCALDMAEQLTPFLALGEDEPLYQTLLALLGSAAATADRGLVLTALRAMGRIAMNLPQTNRLGRVPAVVLQRVAAGWLLLHDDELKDACLDFLYQYTAVAANVERLLAAVPTEHLVSHLVRLLSHGAKRGRRELVLAAEQRRPATEAVLPLPPDLETQLVATDEPERCYAWLRCFFEEDREASITQIAIWQAYQSSFLQPVQQSGRTMLGAAEFIRNVTHVYHAAGAQIQKEQTPQGEVQKFIIKGIRPRVRPVSPDGRELFACPWLAAAEAAKNPKETVHRQCGVFFASAASLYRHILQQHLGEQEGGGLPSQERECRCWWADCRKYATATTMPLADFVKHIKTHAVALEQAYRQRHQEEQQQQPAQPWQPSTTPLSSQATPASAAPPPSPQHQRQRSSVTSGDLAMAQTPGGSSNGAAAAAAAAATAAKRPKRSYVVPATTIHLAYEETATMRDERNPSLPPQAAGIPLSAVLVLRNIARNAAKAEVPEDDAAVEVDGDGEEAMDVDPGSSSEKSKQKSAAHKNSWNERLFRPMLPRLYEIMAENKALASYIASLFQLLGEE